jgi:hypothetical protein
MNKLLTIGAATMVLALGAAACGGDDDDDESASATTTEETSAETVDVTATEYEFELSATPTADTREITFNNAGQEDHDLIFAKINEGFTLDDALEAQGRKGTAEEIRPVLFAKPGDEAKGTIELDGLEPGNYAMVCSVSSKGGPPHFELGMTEEFTIE